MTENAATPAWRYRAFISYSHQDKAWADWLHKALETYALPKRLVGQTTASGVIPKRLAPIFRDRDELASAHNLGAKVSEALAQSANLIVICSPRSATSRWVNEEVLAYKRLGRSERIFCLIVDGEPNASDLPGRAAEECFAPALRFQLDAAGEPTRLPTEPIAADARPGMDGKGNAKLKLIAGLLDVGFDQLKQRELQRRTRRMTAIAALAVAVMAVTTTLAIFALVSRHAAEVARQAAERRQKQAEDLVGFMLGDLNDRLNEVHRLDIMQSVDDKAMAYFASLPAADASDAALLLRVNAMQKIGSVRTEANGELAAALGAYQAAATLAAELARRAPGDMQRQATLGESQMWIGMAYWQQGDLTHALQYFEKAIVLLARAHAARPHDNELAADLASARNNAGHVLDARGDFAAASIEYDATLKIYQDLARREPGNSSWQSNLGYAWNNLGKLALEGGGIEQAITAYRADQRIKSTLAANDPHNRQARQDLLVSDAILGRTLALCGYLDMGLHFTDAALSEAKSLLEFDGTNTGWQDFFALYSQQAGSMLRQLGKLDQAATADAEALRVLDELLKKDPISSDFQQDLSQAQLENARLQLARNNTSAAVNQTQAAVRTINELRTKAPDDRSSLLLAAQAHMILGEIASRNRDRASADREWSQARDLLQPALRVGDNPNFIAVYTEALLQLGQLDAARPLISKLNKMGYRTPDFVAILAARQIEYPDHTDFTRRIEAIMK